jgi:hypothetical protein
MLRSFGNKEKIFVCLIIEVFYNHNPLVWPIISWSILTQMLCCKWCWNTHKCFTKFFKCSDHLIKSQNVVPFWLLKCAITKVPILIGNIFSFLTEIYLVNDIRSTKRCPTTFLQMFRSSKLSIVHNQFVCLGNLWMNL